MFRSNEEREDRNGILSDTLIYFLCCILCGHVAGLNWVGECFATSDMMLPSLEQHTGTLLKYNVSGKNQSNLIITSSKNPECIIELEA